MEMTAGTRWRDAYNAGAKAVILLSSDRETTHDAHAHIIPIPVYVPRFYVPEGPLAAALRDGAARAGVISCRAEWAEARATNVYALVPAAGTSGGKALAIGVPFDSAGAVPTQAPGADVAVDIAVALNALRDFVADPPARPLLFAFIDAYAVNQFGLREMLATLCSAPDEGTRVECLEGDRERADEYGRHESLAAELDVREMRFRKALGLDDLRAASFEFLFGTRLIRDTWRWVRDNAAAGGDLPEGSPERLALEIEALNRLHRRRYRPLWGYVKDEVARGVVEIEQFIYPERVNEFALLREQARLQSELKTFGPDRAPEREELQQRLGEIEKQLGATRGAIATLSRKRNIRNSAQELLLSNEPIQPALAGAPGGDGDAAGAAEVARTVWKAARERISRQAAESAALVRRHEEHDRIRSDILAALGATNATTRPVEFLLGIDLSDAGIAAGPCFWDPYLGVNVRQNGASFARWLETLERSRADKVWPGELRRGVDLTPLRITESPDSHVVGPLPLFSGSAQSFALPAATWATINALRSRVDTPRDRADLLEWGRIGPQAEATARLLRDLASDTGFRPSTPIRAKWSRASGDIVDQAPGEPVPRLPMARYLTVLVLGNAGSGQGTSWSGPAAGVRREEFRWTGADGTFRFEALPGHRGGGLAPHFVQSFMIGPEGDITRAVDMQKQGRGVRLGVDLSASKAPPLRAAVFRCGELTAAGLFDPRFLVNLAATSVLDARSASTPKRMNLLRYGDLMSCQLELDTRWQLVLRAGIAGNRMALLNVAHPEPGMKTSELLRGFALGEPLPAHPLQIAAQDFQRLDRKRLDDCTAAGITSQPIRRIQEGTAAALEQAEAAGSRDDGAGLLSAISGAMSNEVRAYQAVRDMSNDVIRGAIFLLLMLVPFAYALERLVFASAHIYRQMAGTLGIFAVMALILWQYHPAFRLSGQPMMVIMAFAIIFMSLLVISVVYRKFQSGLEDLQSGRAEASGARTSRIGLLTTALRLGIANMRRRRFRTALTGLTVVLITFAMLCFMSTSSYIGHKEFSLGQTAQFSGALVRQPALRAMPGGAFEHIEHIMGGMRDVVPRYWWNNQGNAQWRIQVSNPATGQRVFLIAALGLAPAESRLTAIKQACAGWERFAAGGACYLSAEAATELGVQPGGAVVIAGRELELAGVFDAAALRESVRDLDGQVLLPVDYSRMSGEERRLRTATGVEELSVEMESGATLEPEQALPYVATESLAILPASLLAGMPGSTLRSIALGAESAADVEGLARGLSARFAFPIYYGAQGNDVRVLAATPLLPRAPKSLLIPVVIAGLIIFNTMLSSIAERRREIYIYTSLGLAPLHVGFLFLAEALTYGLMGSIFGYIVGQGTATAFKELGWMGGLTLNYSGTQAVMTMVMVLGVVIISSLVPAFMAGKLATPSNEMKWKVPEPVDGTIRDKLPFTVTGKTANGVMTFLYEYLDAHREGSIGHFTTDDLRLFRTRVGGEELMGVEATVWLAPYDLGIRQDLRLVIRETVEPDVFQTHVELVRRSGQESSWRKLNRVLLADLRRQLLGWRKLKLERMLEYIAQAKERLGSAVAGGPA